MSDETSSAPAGVYGGSGSLLRTVRPAPDDTDQLAAFVRQQPLTAALAALAIGYVLGKIS